MVSMSKPEEALINKRLKNRVMQIGRHIESASLTVRKQKHQNMILLGHHIHYAGIHKFISADQS